MWRIREAAQKQTIAELEYSRIILRRLEPLLAKQFVTVDQVDQARTAARAKDEAVKQAEAQLRLSEARLASGPCGGAALGGGVRPEPRPSDAVRTGYLYS